MRRIALIALAASAPLLVAAHHAEAQTAQPAVITDLLSDIKVVHRKLVDLANAIPADKYDWRPGEGVRSVAEVFKHVAADNYLIPVIGGAKAPAETGITSDYQTSSAFEARKLDKAAIVSELDKSFTWLEGQLGATTQAHLTDKVSVFGTDGTMQTLWVMAVTHSHEHLGQTIAYARSNGVVPPWSR